MREAWKRFHTALTHESAERKALAYLGLALCQHRLGEPRAAISTLKELSRYKDEYETDQAKKKTTSNTIEIGLVAIGSVAMVAIIGPLGILVAAESVFKSLMVGANKPKPPTVEEMTVAKIAEQAQYLVNEAEKAEGG